MAGRRTNLALLALLLLAFVTGVASWLVGPGVVRVIVIAHGIMGLSIVVLAPWKGMIARRGLQRRRSGRGTAIALAVLIITSIVAALVHVTGAVGSVGTLSPLGIHVATAIVVIARPARRKKDRITLVIYFTRRSQQEDLQASMYLRPHPQGR